MDINANKVAIEGGGRVAPEAELLHQLAIITFVLSIQFE